MPHPANASHHNHLHRFRRADDPEQRSQALEHIARTAPSATVAAVAAEALADADAGIREQASYLLVEQPTLEDAEHVAPHIASEDITTRNLAGEVLVQMGTVAVEALAPYLADDDHDTRKFAIDVLAQLPDAARPLAPEIAKALDDPDANVRLAAIAALGELGAAEYSDELRARYDEHPLARPDVVHAMGAFGPQADLELLEDALGDENPVVQLAATEALSTLHAPEILDLLLRKVDDVDPMARPVVLNGIVERCQTQQAPPELPARLKVYFLDMLSDPSPEYRCAAAQGLRFFSDEGTFEAMLAHAGHDDDLDMELFKTLTTHPEPFLPVYRTTETGQMDGGTAATFTVGLLAQGAVQEPYMARAGTFLQRHFEALSADDKMTAIGLCQQLDRPELQGVLLAAQSDPDPSISSFAADTASPFA